LSTATEVGAGERIIEPRAPGLIARLAELWRDRRLINYFGRRYIRKLYARTFLGWLWIPLRPILEVGAAVLIFGGLLSAPSSGVPYLLFFLVGITAWAVLDRGLYWMTRSLDLNKRYLKILYIPRLTMLLGAVLPTLLEASLYAALLVLAIFYFVLTDGQSYVVASWALLVAPAAIAAVALVAVSFGFFTAIFGAQSRDMRFSLSYITRFWFFMTPVIYPLSSVPPSYRTLACLNPMVAPVEMFRASIFSRGGHVPATGFASTGLTILLVGGLGLWFYNRSETAALDGA